MKTKKAQLIFHIWLKLVWRVCDLCLEVLPVEAASAEKNHLKSFLFFCFFEGNVVFNGPICLRFTSVFTPFTSAQHVTAFIVFLCESGSRLTTDAAMPRTQKLRTW